MKHINRSQRCTTQSKRGLSSMLAVLIAVTALQTGCASQTVEEVEGLENTGRADSHRVQSQRLKKIMQEMNFAVYERESTALYVDEMRLRRARELAEILPKISEEIVNFAQTKTDIEMKPDERQRFVQYARDLDNHGKALNDVATSERVKDLKPVMKRMVQTCNACHNQFRDM